MVMITSQNLTLAHTVEIDAAPLRVWQALTDGLALNTWMGQNNQIDLRVGGSVAFYGGSTTGCITRLHEGRILEYTWRQQNWPTHWPDSVVLWELKAGHTPGTTRLKLTHRYLPTIGERESHQVGWWVYWLDPMADWLEGRSVV